MCFVCLTCPDLFIVCFLRFITFKVMLLDENSIKMNWTCLLSSHAQDRIKVHSAQTKAASYGLCVS